MSLVSALNSSLTSLSVVQDSIATSSNNIANVNTTGYIKQQVNQGAIFAGGIGQGVEILGYSASVDQQLLKSMQTQISDLGGANVLQSYFDKIQSLFGDPNSDTNLSAKIDNFFNAFNSLSANPETISLKVAAINAAKDLANNLSNIATNLEKLRLQADQDIHSDVTSINSIIARLADSNAQINNFAEGSQGRLGVDQQRQLDLQKLSEFINVSTTVDSHGFLSVLTGSGISLLDNTGRYTVNHITAPSVDQFLNNSDMTSITTALIQADGSSNSSSGSTLVTGGASDEISTDLTSGTIKSLLQMRDAEIPKIIEQLNNLATKIADQVNAIHNDGSSFPPQSSLTGTTELTSTTELGFDGSVMIAIVNQDGTPASSPFGDEVYYRPLTLDLSSLDSGDGAGKPTVQTIMDEINYYLGPVQNRAVVGNLRDISLAAISNNITDAGTAQFDLQLDNISGTSATVVINSITVIDPNDLSTTYNAATLPVPNTYTINSGDRERTGIPFTVDFGGDDNRASYTVRLQVQVTDGDGNVSTANIDYTIPDNVTDIKNTRYAAAAVTNVAGTSNFYPAPSSQTYAHASLIQADGTPAAPGQPGYLKIETTSGQNFGIAIDELDSEEVGLPSTASSNITHKGFSNYFGLNDFFVTNQDGLTNAAVNMSVRSDIVRNPGALATGSLVLSNQPSDPTTPLFTYELGSGNGDVIKRIAELDQANVSFSATDSLPAVTTTFNRYSAEIIGYSSTLAVEKQSSQQIASLGMDGLKELFQKTGGVNTDEELSKIMELESVFRASARIINIVQELLKTLTQAF